MLADTAPAADASAPPVLLLLLFLLLLSLLRLLLLSCTALELSLASDPAPDCAVETVGGVVVCPYALTLNARAMAVLIKVLFMAVSSLPKVDRSFFRQGRTRPAFASLQA
ncbi:MAG TPA: hypothetical protein VFT05_14980 [Burkholderiaceae bacterium]|nr:hypothetical protein [Burkholderiaceae bacterium]